MSWADLLFRGLQRCDISCHLVLSSSELLDDVPHNGEVARHHLKLVLRLRRRSSRDRHWCGLNAGSFWHKGCVLRRLLI